MRKKYSDPLIFASRSILTTIPVTPSQSGHTTPDDEWEDDAEGLKSSFSINSFSAAPASEEPVTIVNPVEEAVNSATTAATSTTAGVTTESAVEAVTTSPLEVESVIDEIVPDESVEAATTAAAAATIY